VSILKMRATAVPPRPLTAGRSASIMGASTRPLTTGRDIPRASAASPPFAHHVPPALAGGCAGAGLLVGGGGRGFERRFVRLGCACPGLPLRVEVPGGFVLLRLAEGGTSAEVNRYRSFPVGAVG
jgi:hypothetical protein